MKFNLRDLFLLILIVAIALGWWQEHRRSQQLRRETLELTARIEALHNEVAKLEGQQMKREVMSGLIAPLPFRGRN
jgi:hypothetical protein